MFNRSCTENCHNYQVKASAITEAEDGSENQKKFPFNLKPYEYEKD
jgi:hypothetical protein